MIMARPTLKMLIKRAFTGALIHQGEYQQQPTTRTATYFYVQDY